MNTQMHTSLGRALDIHAVIEGRRRLSLPEACRLYHEASLHELGAWSSAMAQRMHGDSQRTYVIDRNINYTNVCSAHCTFCAFRRDQTDDDAYTLSTQALHEKVRQLVEIGGTQVLLQGGMHPELGLEFYIELLRGLKAAFPAVHIHGFSPPEFVEFVAVVDVPGFPTPGVKRSHELSRELWLSKLKAIMSTLAEAGLDSLPGGGGEIFAEHVRRRIGLGKATARQWLDVMSTAHQLGMFTSATMMFGHIEGITDRIDHMRQVRDRQDQAVEAGWPGRYVSFISWPFQRENTPLGRVPDWDAHGEDDERNQRQAQADAQADAQAQREAESANPAAPFPGDVLADAVEAAMVDPANKAACDAWAPRAGKVVRMAGASDYLRTQAISRLFLDNVANIGSSWVTMGPHIGQLGLSFGANDMGSVMMEENVVSAAGTTYCLDEAVLCRLIRDAGYTPVQRDNVYRPLKIHDNGSSPDQSVTDWSTHRASSLHVQTDAAEAGNSHEASENEVTLTIGSADEVG